nr:hypothetical protein [Tanacetum cinerariifolium]
ETEESDMAGVAKQLKQSDEMQTGETEESDLAGVAKQLKQSDEMQTGSINKLKPEELISLLEKVENMLPSYPNLLAFRSSVPLRNSDLKLLALSCPKLEALLLDRQSDLVPPPVDVDFDNHGVSELAICNHLEVVLSGRMNVGDFGVVSLVRSTQKLQTLNLEGCINVTDETLKAIGMLTHLRYLDLKDCSRITDLGLKYLADGGSKSSLYNLSLNNCGMSITDVGITAISHIESLWALDISMLTNVTDVSLVAISSRCRLLHSIFLNGCVTITGGGFRALTNCGWIGELAMVNCPNITWDDVMPRSLHSIFLNGCMAITGDGFRALTNCGWIGELAVVDCPNITWDDVVFVGCALEVLEYISLDRRMENPVPEAGSKRDFQFGENHVQVTWE